MQPVYILHSLALWNTVSISATAAIFTNGNRCTTWNIYLHLCVPVSLLASNVMQITNTDSDININGGCQCTEAVTKNKTERLTFVFNKWQASHTSVTKIKPHSLNFMHAGNRELSCRHQHENAKLNFDNILRVFLHAGCHWYENLRHNLRLVTFFVFI